LKNRRGLQYSALNESTNAKFSAAFAAAYPGVTI